jgi:hypothetical protein
MRPPTIDHAPEQAFVITSNGNTGHAGLERVGLLEPKWYSNLPGIVDVTI